MWYCRCDWKDRQFAAGINASNQTDLAGTEPWTLASLWLICFYDDKFSGMVPPSSKSRPSRPALTWAHQATSFYVSPRFFSLLSLYSLDLHSFISLFNPNWFGCGEGFWRNKERTSVPGVTWHLTQVAEISSARCFSATTCWRTRMRALAGGYYLRAQDWCRALHSFSPHSFHCVALTSHTCYLFDLSCKLSIASEVLCLWAYVLRNGGASYHGCSSESRLMYLGRDPQAHNDPVLGRWP